MSLDLGNHCTNFFLTSFDGITTVCIYIRVSTICIKPYPYHDSIFVPLRSNLQYLGDMYKLILSM